MNGVHTSFLSWCQDFLSGTSGLWLERVRVEGDHAGEADALLVTFEALEGGRVDWDFFPESCSWGTGPFPDEALGTFAIREDGQLYPVGEDDFNFGLQIHHPLQIVEVVEGYQLLGREAPDNRRFMCLSDLLDDPIGVYPTPEGGRQVDLLAALELELPEGLRVLFEAWLRGDLDGVVEEGGTTWPDTLKAIAELHPQVGSPYVGAPALLTTAAGITPDPKGLKSGVVSGVGDLRIAWSIPTSQVPITFVAELLCGTAEGRSALGECPLYEPGKAREYLGKAVIQVPADRAEQLRVGLEWASLRHAVAARIEELLTRVDPLAYRTHLQARRLRTMELLDSGHHGRRSIWESGPFPLERAFVHWERSGAGEARVATGFSALGLFVRLPVLLALEELVALGMLADLPRRISGNLKKGHPLTEGQWFKLGRTLLVDFREHLHWSGPVLEVLEAEEGRLLILLEARNSWAHSSSLDRGTLTKDLGAELEDHLSVLRTAGRKAWQHRRLVVPTALRYLNERLYLDCLDLSGPEKPFAFATEAVVGAPETFPVDTVVMTYEQRGLPLRTYFRWAPEAPNGPAIGLYDRLKGDEPSFLFVT